MDSPRGTLRSIFILACLFSDMARSLKNEENPSDFKALEILRRQKDSTQVKEILPVEVNIGGLVNSFNEQIQKLGDHVTRLDNQLQIIKGNEERHLESYKAELERSRNKLEEAQNSFKEEIYRLKNESTAIKAENERLKMKLEATTHEGTTSRPKTNAWENFLPPQPCPTGPKGRKCRRNLENNNPSDSDDDAWENFLPPQPCPTGPKGRKCRRNLKNNNPSDSDDDNAGQQCPTGLKGRKCRLNRKNNP